MEKNSTTTGIDTHARVMNARQRFTLTRGREERFLACDTCFPPARTIHIFL